MNTEKSDELSRNHTWTQQPKDQLLWRGKSIYDLSREELLGAVRSLILSAERDRTERERRSVLLEAGKPGC